MVPAHRCNQLEIDTGGNIWTDLGEPLQCPERRPIAVFPITSIGPTLNVVNRSGPEQFGTAQ